MLETANLPTHRRAWRRTDDLTPGAPKVKLVVKPLRLPLSPTQVLIKVRAVALNYRDANIANGGNPWPVLPRGILGNDAAGDKFVTGREPGRSWRAADQDAVLADHLVFDEKLLAKLPPHVDWVNWSIIPCAGATAWSARKGLSIGQSVLSQDTGGVAMFALKLAQASGFKIILSSPSDAKIEATQKASPSAPVYGVSNSANPN
ncbi:alcohol dehydrogenase GroES-like domain-containing protein [Colletotrichum graminicola]|nr:alcohol dehydrogenase GroES-like domain-containing protein [Colletotrichum graminicola]